MTNPIDLFYWPTPNGWKISIALEEMNLPYNLHLVNIGAGDQFDPEFLKIAPNNRMPAIIDPDGPDGEPISVFESGAILQYLARKTGQFCGPNPTRPHRRGPVAYVADGRRRPDGRPGAPFPEIRPLDGAAERFALCQGPLSQRGQPPVPRFGHPTGGTTNTWRGDFYSIADMAIWPWASLWEGQEQTLDDKPHLKRWLDEVGARPAVQKGRALAADKRKNLQDSKKAQKVLFGQKG